MEEKNVINLMVAVSVILSLIGVFFVFANDWTEVNLFGARIGQPTGEINKLSILKHLPDLLGFDQEKTYLLLFQNNLELRPSGGYLGSFAIIKFNKAKITHLGIHDTNIFDGFGKEYTRPPQPLENYLGIENWQMRDANWSPDYLTSVQQVEKFYHLQGGQETFDGIIAVNAGLLPRLLEITGPVYLPEFDKELKAEDVLYQLEYEVEKNYHNRGIEPGERKSMLKSLVKEIIGQITSREYLTDSALRRMVLEELDKKNILISLKDSKIQELISQKNWSGEVEKNYPGNYLMLVEANLIGKKSNAFVQRQVSYKIDYTNPKPKVDLEIDFSHSNPEKDWFNDDYRCYLRVYLPQGAWLVKFSGLRQGPEFSEDLGKTVVGGYLIVPAGESKKVSFTYLLPEEFKQVQQPLLIQKQPGIDSINYHFTVRQTGEKDYNFSRSIWRDELISLP